MRLKLFKNCEAALKEIGFYHVRVEEETGRLVAAYTPTKEVLTELESEEPGSGRCTTGKYKEFDLWISGWEDDQCRPMVVLEPDGRRSPQHIYPNGPALWWAAGGSSSAIKSIGHMALNSPFGP